MGCMKHAVVVIFSLCMALPLQAATLEEKVVEHTFQNGLKLLMVERHSSPTVSAWIRFKVGSVHERSDERGLAHLLEHMLFKGTKTLGTRDYAAEASLLEKIEQTAQLMLAEEAKGNKADKAKLAAFVLLNLNTTPKLDLAAAGFVNIQ